MSNRFKSPSKTSGEDGSSESSFESQQFDQKLIWKANKVPLLLIFNHYKLYISESNYKVTCPFLSHKGGREKTGSFYYYSKSNSYCCFGCRIGSHGCDFVAEMDGISKRSAAEKILRLYGSEVPVDDYLASDYSERLELIMGFSEIVREFIQANSNSDDAVKYIENLTLTFDEMYIKHKLDVTALKRLVSFLKDKVSDYKPCPQF